MTLESTIALLRSESRLSQNQPLQWTSDCRSDSRETPCDSRDNKRPTEMDDSESATVATINPLTVKADSEKYPCAQIPSVQSLRQSRQSCDSQKATVAHVSIREHNELTQKCDSRDNNPPPLRASTCAGAGAGEMRRGPITVATVATVALSNIATVANQTYDHQCQTCLNLLLGWRPNAPSGSQCRHGHSAALESITRYFWCIDHRKKQAPR